MSYWRLSYCNFWIHNAKEFKSLQIPINTIFLIFSSSSFSFFFSFFHSFFFFKLNFVEPIIPLLKQTKSRIISCKLLLKPSAQINFLRFWTFRAMNEWNRIISLDYIYCFDLITLLLVYINVIVHFFWNFISILYLFEWIHRFVSFSLIWSRDSLYICRTTMHLKAADSK